MSYLLPSRISSVCRTIVDMNQKKYTIGLLFNNDLSKILLVHKEKPEWQKGKINAVGGKFENGETGLDCIVREVREETSLNTDAHMWSHIGTLYQDFGDMEVFGCIYKGEESDAQKNDHEDIEWFSVDNIPTNIMENLRWIIPLTLDKIKNDSFKTFSVSYVEKAAKI